MSERAGGSRLEESADSLPEGVMGCRCSLPTVEEVKLGETVETPGDAEDRVEEDVVDAVVGVGGTRPSTDKQQAKYISSDAFTYKQALLQVIATSGGS